MKPQVTRELHEAAILWIQQNIEAAFPNEATPAEVAAMLDAYAEEEQISVESMIEEIQKHHRVPATQQQDLFDQRTYLD